MHNPYQKFNEKRDYGLAFGNCMSAATLLIATHPLFKDRSLQELVESIKQVQQELFKFAIEKQTEFKADIENGTSEEGEPMIDASKEPY